MAYSGWELPAEERARLLGMFPPAYSDVIGHHVTLRMGKAATLELPPEAEACVVGVADDGEAVQALVVEINGTCIRPDGKTFHITWSLDKEKGAKPVDSNRVIADGKWVVTAPYWITVKPKIFG